MANPKGNPQNLVQNKQQAPNERRMSAERAWTASAKSRSEYRTLKDTLKDMLTPEKRAAICDALMEKAANGDLRAIELLRDTIGEKPVQETETKLDFGLSKEDSSLLAKVGARLNASDG